MYVKELQKEVETELCFDRCGSRPVAVHWPQLIQAESGAGLKYLSHLLLLFPAIIHRELGAGAEVGLPGHNLMPIWAANYRQQLYVLHRSSSSAIEPTKFWKIQNKLKDLYFHL